MARKPRQIPRRDDWVEVEEFPLADGSGRSTIAWMNVITNERATLVKGTHPIDNPNAVSAPNALPALIGGGNEQPDDDPDSEPDDEESAVDSVTRFLRGGAVGGGRADVKVYRKRPDGLGYCTQYTPDEFLEGGHNMIREQWGAGKYKVILYATNPEGRNYARRASQEIVIEESKAPAKTGDENGAVTRLLERMDSRLAALETNRPDPSAQIMQTLAMMKAMREAMGVSNAPAAPAVDPMMQLASTFKMMKMLREEIEPAQTPDDPLLAIAPKAMDLLSAALSQNNQQGALPQIAAAPMPTMQQLPQPVPAPATAQSEDDEMQIKFALWWLKSQAAKNADATEVAEKIYDESPDDVLAIIESDEWWPALLNLDASLAAHETYLKTVREKLLAIIAEESADDPERIGAGVRDSDKAA